MDEQQQQRINEAAQQFTDALVESYRAVSDRTVSAQESGVQLTQDFFNRVADNLRTQAENTRQIGQELVGQQQRQWEAAQTLAQESTNAYMDFVNSMFYFYQGSVEAAERSSGAGSSGTITPDSPVSTEEPSTEEPPIEDYDSLNVNQVSQRLGELSVEEIERLREYEAANKNRRSLIQRFDTRIEAARSS
jgi:ABC-type transporter Mla subunit MlaD